MVVITENINNNGRDKSYGYGIFSFGRIGNKEYILNESVKSIPDVSAKKFSTAKDLAAVLMAYKFLDLY